MLLINSYLLDQFFLLLNVWVVVVACGLFSLWRDASCVGLLRQHVAIFLWAYYRRSKCLNNYRIKLQENYKHECLNLEKMFPFPVTLLTYPVFIWFFPLRLRHRRTKYIYSSTLLEPIMTGKRHLFFPYNNEKVERLKT